MFPTGLSITGLLMLALRRFTYSLAASLLVLWAVSFDGLAAAPSGVHITPNGFRVPVYGMSFTRDAQGKLGTECTRLTAEQIDGARLARTVTRAMLAEYPRSTVRAESGATFQIIYTDPPGTGFLDAARGPVRKRAMEASIAAWSAVLQGTIPIVVQVRMETPDDPESSTLASASPVEFFDIAGRLVPSALAAQLRNANVNNGRPDIEVVYNETVGWDYALNGVAAPDAVSFVYTTIHEVGHGLGFTDSFDAETGQLLNALPYPYDMYVNRGSAMSDPVRTHPAPKVLEDLTSNDLFFSGPRAIDASRRSIVPRPMVKLYAPSPYEEGSSISHVDQDTYADIRTGLMTPRDFGRGSNTIDILTLGIMEDMGYKLVPAATRSTHDGPHP